MQKTYYDPNRDRDLEEYIHVQATEYVEVKDDGLFHCGQSYEETPCSTYYCNRCGGKEFNVGAGDHFTAIRCVKCEYEVCVHDG